MAVKRLIGTIIWLLLCAAVPTFAQAPPSEPATEPFAASFVQTRTLPGFAEPLVSHGVLRFSRDDGFRWEVTRPYHYVFAMREGVAHEQLPDGTRRELRPDETPWLKVVQRIFVNALSGHLERLGSWFDVTVEPQADGRLVVLVPKTDAIGQLMTRIEVLESAPGQPQRLDIAEAGGGRMTVRFTPLTAAAGTR